MTNLEQLLRDSMKSAGESYTPADPGVARGRFHARRRRRRLGVWAGGVLLAGAAIAGLALFFTHSDEALQERDGSREIQPVVGPTTAVVNASISVGDAPSGVGVGEGFVWVANSGNDTVSMIDPALNRVVDDIPVPGRPDDVLVRYGYAWVVCRDGTFARIQPETGATEVLYRYRSGAHLDIAKGVDRDVWVLESGGLLHRIDGRSGLEEDSLQVGIHPTDVSIYEKVVWLYDREAGEVLRVDPASHAFLSPPTQVGVSRNADLKTADGYTWFLRGKDGRLLQLAQDSGEIVREVKLGGTFGAITVGRGLIFAMVTEGGVRGSGDGVLYQMDANSAAQINNPIPLTDVPFDVDAGVGAIWVTNNLGDTVTRIGLVRGPG
jgi:YVTN family beta-propeller protein